MRYILLLADHWIPCHPRCMKRKAHLASSAFSLTPLFHHFFFFFQILFSFSTWQRSLKRLSFPNQKLFPDSLPLSYNYSAGPCFSALFFFFPALPLLDPGGDITSSTGQRRVLILYKSEVRLLPPVHTYLITVCYV